MLNFFFWQINDTVLKIGWISFNHIVCHQEGFFFIRICHMSKYILEHLPSCIIK